MDTHFAGTTLEKYFRGRPFPINPHGSPSGSFLSLHPMAFLVLLPAAAGTGIVAADFVFIMSGKSPRNISFG